MSDFDLLHQLYGAVVIPPEVYHEVVERGAGCPVQHYDQILYEVAELPDPRY